MTERLSGADLDACAERYFPDDRLVLALVAEVREYRALVERVGPESAAHRMARKRAGLPALGGDQ